MINEAEKKKIEKEAKEILDKFSKALEKVKVEERAGIDKESGMREESAGKIGDKDFRKRMFDNAPDKDEDCIIAEKGDW